MISPQDIVTGLVRRFAAWPLQVIGPRQRAVVLERATEAMISVAPIPGGSIRFFTPNSMLLWRAESILAKETDMIQWIDGFEEGAVMWDVGANVGIFSLYAGVSRRASVLAFEPSAANFHVLSRNIQLNELSDRVTAFCLALADRTQLGVLNMRSAAMGAAMTQFGQAGERSRYWNGNLQPLVHGMVGFSIDDFVARFDPPFPNHLKMDVDGLELPILEGASAALRDPRLKSMMVELNLNDTAEYQRALALLEGAGFRLSSQGKVQGAQDEKAANHLFERIAP